MKNEIVTFTSPKSSVSEVFKTLRTNIQFMNVAKQSKSILITSTVPEEGKSWISANLAITFAQTGKRVILVDADMRKGRQHEVFEVNNENGLSNYLITAIQNKKIDLANYIKPTLVENLYIMTSGSIPPNPSELLTSPQMLDLIQSLEASADVVIFDGTPSTIVTDAIILSRSIGSTLIVSSFKETKMENLKQVKRNIENVGGRVAGIILNKLPQDNEGYKGSYYYENSLITIKNRNWFKDLKLKIKPKKVAESEIDKAKQDLEKVENQNIQEEKPKARRGRKPTKKVEQQTKPEEDIDINLVLKQLTQYLSEDKNK